MTFYVVPCSGQKLDHPAKARDLYTGTMFRNSLDAALAQCEEGDTVLIMSALHGLVSLDTILAPYECLITDKRAVAEHTLRCHAAWFGMDYNSHVYCFLPREYFVRLYEALGADDICVQNVYEASEGGIGEQRRVLRLVRA